MAVQIDILPSCDEAAFAGLLRFAARGATMIGFVRSPWEGDNDDARLAVVDRLAPYRLASRQVVEWPGTKTTGEPVELLLHSFGDSAMAILLEETPWLGQWMGRGSVEDLHLLRLDGTELFGTISHELVAWLRVEDCEIAELESLFTFERTIVGVRDRPNVIAPGQS